MSQHFDDKDIRSTKVIREFVKLVEIRCSTMCVKYTYHDLTRLFSVLGDSGDDIYDIRVRDDGSGDPLGKILADGIRALPNNDDGSKDSDIDVVSSIAVLIESDLKQFKPLCWTAYDLSNDSTSICGVVTACSFVAAVSFKTDKLTDDYNRRNKLPSFDKNWLLIDVVSSSKKGTATLLLLHAYIAAARAKKHGLVAVAVTKLGKRFFASLNFKHHKKTIFYIKIGDLEFNRIHERLKIDSNLVNKICWPRGLRAPSNVIGRC